MCTLVCAHHSDETTVLWPIRTWVMWYDSQLSLLGPHPCCFPHPTMLWHFVFLVSSTCGSPIPLLSLGTCYPCFMESVSSPSVLLFTGSWKTTSSSLPPSWVCPVWPPWRPVSHQLTHVLTVTQALITLSLCCSFTIIRSIRVWVPGAGTRRYCLSNHYTLLSTTGSCLVSIW